MGAAKAHSQQGDPRVPLALLISALSLKCTAAGDCGAFLCFEGREGKAHSASPRRSTRHARNAPAASGSAGSRIQKLSNAIKSKGAVRTDFILSAEIVAITWYCV